jgi:hypothetical protein
MKVIGSEDLDRVSGGLLCTRIGPFGFHKSR